MALEFEALTEKLFEVGAIKIDTEGPGFKLKDGSSSPIYINMRTPSNPKPGPLTREIVEDIGLQLFQFARLNQHKIRWDGVAGLPNAGDPLAEAFWKAAQEAKIPTGLAVLGKQGEGDDRRIAGIRYKKDLEEGAELLIIDDLVTKGLSKQEGIHAIEGAGHKVSGILVLIDRRRNKQDILSEDGPNIWALGTLEAMVAQLAASESITDKAARRVLDHLATGV